PVTSIVAIVLALVLAGACGGDGGGTSAPGLTIPANTTAPPITLSGTPVPTRPAPPPPEGVETFTVASATHASGRVDYAQAPPVGGPHSPGWEPCGFYAGPVSSEAAVHSLEHGAVWVTYRPDLAPAEIAVLEALARSRSHILVSRWDDGLPAPVVASSWGRQLRLPSATDPRLAQFVSAFIGQAPEPNASC
ncbi:MAG: DUF3105 domain-containing protein, partial [Acidimicrobiales bacterium]